MNADSYFSHKNKIKVSTCDDCKKDFLVNSIDIKKDIIYIRDWDVELEFQYFVCPHCGKVYKILMLDKTAKMLQNDFSVYSNRIKRAVNTGKTIPEAKTKALSRKRDRFEKYLAKLEEHYKDIDFTVYLNKNNADQEPSMNGKGE